MYIQRVYVNAKTGLFVVVPWFHIVGVEVARRRQLLRSYTTAILFSQLYFRVAVPRKLCPHAVVHVKREPFFCRSPLETLILHPNTYSDFEQNATHGMQ